MKLLSQYLAVRRARRGGTAPTTLPLLSIELTPACNARCAMCGYPDHYPRGNALLTTAEIDAIVAEAAALGARVISLGGGEPMLRPDFAEIVQAVTGRGVTALVHSNGSLLTPRKLAALAGNRRLVWSFSVDAARRTEHDGIRGVACFDRIMTASARLAGRRGGAGVAWLMTVAPKNVDQMLPVMQLAHDLGVRTVRYTPVHANLQHRHKPAGELVLHRLDPAARTAALAAQMAGVRVFARRHGMTTNSAAFFDGIVPALAGRVPHACHAGFFFHVIDPYGQLMPCYDHPTGVDIRAVGSLAAALAHPAQQAARDAVRACAHACWNVGTAEPSLRLDLRRLSREGRQLVREIGAFLR